MASTSCRTTSWRGAGGELGLGALLAVTILLASMVSIEIGLSVALIELAAGVAVGNLFTVTVPDWLSFVGTFAGVMLTFLAGAEVDVPQFRREWQASISIGAVSFAAPFVVALGACYWLGGGERGPGESRRPGALDPQPGRGLRGAGRDRPQPLRDRQAHHVGHVRDGHPDGDRPLGAVHHAERLGDPVRGGLGRIHLGLAQGLTVVLRALRRSRDRARDQARVRCP